MATVVGALRAGTARWVVLAAVGAALLWFGVSVLLAEPVVSSIAYGLSIDSAPDGPPAHQGRTRCAAAPARWTGDDSVRQTVSLDGGPEHIDPGGGGVSSISDANGTRTLVAADGTSPECGFRTEDAMGIAAVVAGGVSLGVAAVGMRRRRADRTAPPSEDPSR